MVTNDSPAGETSGDNCPFCGSAKYTGMLNRDYYLCLSKKGHPQSTACLLRQRNQLQQEIKVLQSRLLAAARLLKDWVDCSNKQSFHGQVSCQETEDFLNEQWECYLLVLREGSNDWSLQNLGLLRVRWETLWPERRIGERGRKAAFAPKGKAPWIKSSVLWKMANIIACFALKDANIFSTGDANYMQPSRK